MLSIYALEKPKDQWNHKHIQAFPQQSVGVTHFNEALAKTEPNLPDRWLYPETTSFGTKPSDGGIGSAPARVVDRSWNNRNPRKTKWAERIQSVPNPALKSDVFVASTFHLSYAMKKAQIYNSLSGGKQYTPPPGPFSLPLGQIPRGNNVPRVVAREDPQENPIRTGAQEHESRKRLIAKNNVPLGSTAPKLPKKGFL